MSASQRRIPTLGAAAAGSRKENAQPASTINRPSARPPVSKASMGSNSDLSSIRSANTTLNGDQSLMNRSTTSLSVTSSATSSTANLPKSQTSSRINSTLTRANSGTSLNSSRNSLSNQGSSELVKNIEDIVARNKLLEEENAVLKNLIHEETSSDRLDSRRSLMLKCQIYQLEKQINILSKSLSFRKNSHVEAYNAISYLSDCFRSVQNSESKNTHYQIDKNEFQRWLDMTESAKIKLYKNMDNEQQNEESMNEPSLLEHKYSNKSDKTCDILDICSGNLNHINIKQVSLLESEMADLYKKLTRLRDSLSTFQNSTGSESKMLPLHMESLNALLDDSIKSTTQTCSNLFDLSLLIPSAPWGPVRKSNIEGLSLETLMAKLKSCGLPKAKQQPVENLLKSYYTASNYHNHMKTMEYAALSEELKFYRSCYSVQKTYVDSVMSLFRTKYEQFIQELNESFNQPLRLLINKFWQMKDQSTEDNLKEFLGLFKSYAKRFDSILDSFELLPRSDLITATFINMIRQLDAQVAKLNKECQSNIEKLNIERIDLEELSLKSDYLLGDLLAQQENL